MLVYDITNSKSFDNIAKWLRNIQEHANEDVEKMILGNKCDMEDKRVIPKERGEAIGKGKRNVFSSHQIALRSIFKNLVKWQQDLKISSNGNKMFKNLVKWQHDFKKSRQMTTRF